MTQKEEKFLKAIMMTFVILFVMTVTLGILVSGFKEGLFYSDKIYSPDRCGAWPVTKGDMIKVTIPLGCKIGKWWSEPIDPLERE